MKTVTEYSRTPQNICSLMRKVMESSVCRSHLYKKKQTCFHVCWFVQFTVKGSVLFRDVGRSSMAQHDLLIGEGNVCVAAEMHMLSRQHKHKALLEGKPNSLLQNNRHKTMIN